MTSFGASFVVVPREVRPTPARALGAAMGEAGAVMRGPFALGRRSPGRIGEGARDDATFHSRLTSVLASVALFVGTGLAAVAAPSSSAYGTAHAQAPAAAKPGTEVHLADGLVYRDLRVGHGAVAKAGDVVHVHYVGTLDNGTKFDSSRDRGTPFSFTLGQGQVIPGWDRGVVGMRVGGIRRLVIPAALGYGDRGAGGVIPPGATLHFDVELLGVGG